jgi:hypothetical protein
MREREERRKVLLQARMHSDAGWSDVTLRNISKRGMEISAHQPITPGSYVEICRAPYTIVARIVWVAGDRLGARSQDPIDVDGLVAAAAGEQPGTGKIGHIADAPQRLERRSAERAARNEALSSRLQFVALGAAVAVAAFLIAAQVSDRLAAPFEQVRSALAGKA